MDDGKMTREGESYWRDDHRELLSKSHDRTVQFLDPKKDHDVSAEESRPTHTNPKKQILPSTSFMEDEAESAKKRGQDLKKGRKRGEPAMPIKEKAITPTPYGDDVTSEISNVSSHERNICSVRLLLAVSVGVILSILAAFFLSPFSQEPLESALSGNTRGKKKTTEPLPSDGRRVSRHNLQLSIFGGIGGHDSELPLPALEGKLSPSYYPLHDTLPVFWIIPYSGSNAAMDILSYCQHLTLANEKSASLPSDEILQVLTYPDNIAHFVNVDTTTKEGLERADRLGLVESRLADVIATPHVPQVADLFQHKLNTGRIFALFRHPVQRAVAEFLQQKDLLPDHPDYIPGLSHLELYQYAQSKFVHENILVRALANVTSIVPTIVTQGHVEIAKKVLEHYVVVGLSDDLGGSMSRFNDYFGWKPQGDWDTCKDNFVAVRNLSGDPVVDPSSDEFHTLADRNWADMLLFEHAR